MDQVFWYSHDKFVERLLDLKLKSTFFSREDIGHNKALQMQTKRYTLWHKQEGKCCFCGIHTYLDIEDGPISERATIEHVRCRAFGGTNIISNLKISCDTCNNVRGTTSFNRFMYRVERYGRPNRRVKRVKPKKGTTAQPSRREEFQKDLDYRGRVLAQLAKLPEAIQAKQLAYYGIDSSYLVDFLPEHTNIQA